MVMPDRARFDNLIQVQCQWPGDSGPTAFDWYPAKAGLTSRQAGGFADPEGSRAQGLLNSLAYNNEMSIKF
jgi:hypothetical protein